MPARIEAGPSAARWLPIAAAILLAWTLPAWTSLAWAAAGQGDPMAAVGRVSRPNGKGECGAVLVRPGRAVTTGHCVASRRWEPRKGLVLVLPDAVFPVQAVRLSPRSPFDAQGRIADLGNDWAVLELGPPEGRAPPPARTADLEALMALLLTEPPLLKLAAEVAEGGTRVESTPGCAPLLLKDGRLLLFRCGAGTGAGRSGSPIFMPDGQGFVLLGLQSGKLTRPEGEVGIAVIPPEAAYR